MDVAGSSTPRHRALVAFDWGASGVWLLNTPEEDLRRGTDRDLDQPRPRPWSKLVSQQLLDDLQQWNDDQDDTSWAGRPRDPTFVQQIQDRARALAERLQDELGDSWEVFYQSNGPMLPVRPPGSWVEKPGRTARRTAGEPSAGRTVSRSPRRLADGGR
jgi:hypothetical protein